MSVKITCKPVCECGYVFDILTLTNTGNSNFVFNPTVCPNCNEEIETFDTIVLPTTPEEYYGVEVSLIPGK